MIGFVTVAALATAALGVNTNLGITHAHYAVYTNSLSTAQLNAIADQTLADAEAETDAAKKMPANAKTNFLIHYVSNETANAVAWFVTASTQSALVNTALTAELATNVVVGGTTYAAPTVTAWTVHSVITITVPTGTAAAAQTDYLSALTTAVNGVSYKEDVDFKYMANAADDANLNVAYITVFASDVDTAVLAALIDIADDAHGGVTATYAVTGSGSRFAPNAPSAAAVAALATNTNGGVKNMHTAVFTGLTLTKGELDNVAMAVIADAKKAFGLPADAETTGHLAYWSVAPNTIYFYGAGATAADAATIESALHPALEESIAANGRTYAAPALTETAVHAVITITLPDGTTTTQADGYTTALNTAIDAAHTNKYSNFFVWKTTAGVFITIFEKSGEDALQAALITLSEAEYNSITGTYAVSGHGAPAAPNFAPAPVPAPTFEFAPFAGLPPGFNITDLTPAQVVALGQATSVPAMLAIIEGESDDGSGSVVIVIIILLLLLSSSAAGAGVAYWYTQIRPKQKTGPDGAENL